MEELKKMHEPETSHELPKLEKRLHELGKKISETQNRLPAHSTKPMIMTELLALEDEYDMIERKIKTLK